MKVCIKKKPFCKDCNELYVKDIIDEMKLIQDSRLKLLNKLKYRIEAINS